MSIKEEKNEETDHERDGQWSLEEYQEDMLRGKR